MCYDSRDEYWKCLSEQEFLKEKGDIEKCGQLRKKFMDNCPSVWVKHFDRKREYEKFKLRDAMDNLKELERIKSEK